MTEHKIEFITNIEWLQSPESDTVQAASEMKTCPLRPVESDQK